MVKETFQNELPDPLITAAVAAGVLGVSRPTLTRLVQSGTLEPEQRLGDSANAALLFRTSVVVHLRKVRDGSIGDVIDRVELDAAGSDPSEDRNAMVRAEWLAAVKRVVAKNGGTFHSGQVRKLVPHDAHTAASGAFITGLVRRRIIEAIPGEYGEYGDDGNRHGSSPCKVYRVTGVLS